MESNSYNNQNNINNQNNEKLDALNAQFVSLLDDFKKYYIFYNKNPDYQEYVNAYTQAKSNIQNINSQVFKITADAESYLNTLAEQTKDINESITEEKTNQQKLLERLSSIQSKTNGANVMIQNYKEIYREQYIRNVTTFFGLILSIYVILKVYKK